MNARALLSGRTLSRVAGIALALALGTNQLRTFPGLPEGGLAWTPLTWGWGSPETCPDRVLGISGDGRVYRAPTHVRVGPDLAGVWLAAHGYADDPRFALLLQRILAEDDVASEIRWPLEFAKQASSCGELSFARTWAGGGGGWQVSGCDLAQERLSVTLDRLVFGAGVLCSTTLEEGPSPLSFGPPTQWTAAVECDWARVQAFVVNGPGASP